MRSLLAGLYAPTRGRPAGAPHLTYTIGRARASHFRLTRRGARVRRASDPGHLLHLLDGDLAVQLQRRRRGLYFLHAAVLVRHGRAALLVGGSGFGKSTAAWALSHQGFRYAGDELAPLDVDDLKVHPCPRALSLKGVPPAPYVLPPDAELTSWGWHVPLESFPAGIWTRPVRVAAVFFVSRRRSEVGRARRLSPAEAAARLYAHALNPLAHADRGLAPAIRVARAVPSFLLGSGDLGAASRRVATLLAPRRRRSERR